MPNLDQVFTSKYLSAADLDGQSYTLVIAGVELQNVGTAEKPDHKLVAHFHKTQKGLVLNKTNAYSIGAVYGLQTEAWAGKTLEVYPDQTMFGGKMVPCIRVRPMYQRAAGLPGQNVNAPLNGPITPPAPPPVMSVDGPGGLDDDIPF